LGVRRSLSGESAEAAIQLYDPKALPAAQLGSIRPNRSFDVTPALAFAMHPAAGIDERVYSHRRKLAIDPSVEGLSRLRLAPEDVAQSRADLADLRLVDADSQQWPYLMKRDARSQNAELVVRDSSSSKRKTTYELAPPVAPLRIDQLTFKSEAPFFDRAYRLVAIDQDGRKRELARGRLVKRARSPQPVRIAFERQPTHALELIVEDGDDAPLRFDSVESRVWLPELFLVAPKGDYALLIGNPDAQRPRYELERVRNVVLAVSSNPVTVGPLAQNRRYSLTARLGAGDGTTGLVRSAAVWAVLLLAVAVLAVLTFRIARQEPEGEAPRESSDA
jgi:hypothetical protein